MTLLQYTCVLWGIGHERCATAALPHTAGGQDGLRCSDKRKGPGVRDLIQRDYALSGQFDRHTFDVAVANGRAFLAAQASHLRVRLHQIFIGRLSTQPLGRLMMYGKVLHLPLRIFCPSSKRDIKNYSHLRRGYSLA